MSQQTIAIEQISPDVAPIITVFPDISIFKSKYPKFLDQSSNEASMHAAVHELTLQVLKFAKQRNDTLIKTTPTLLPILRGALPMYAAVSQALPSSTCVLAIGSRAHGDSGVKIEWPGRRPFPLDPGDSHILLLDTVIATGGTILNICDELMALSGSSLKYITILACYVSPIGVAAVAKHPLVREIVVGSKAESVDENGFVVPYPGDVGDKLFGKRAS